MIQDLFAAHSVLNFAVIGFILLTVILLSNPPQELELKEKR